METFRIQATGFNSCMIYFGEKNNLPKLVVNRIPCHGTVHYPRDYNRNCVYRDDKFFEEPNPVTRDKVLELVDAAAITWMKTNPDALKQEGLKRLNEQLERLERERNELLEQAMDKTQEIIAKKKEIQEKS